ncbi:PEP-utilizing enzyme [Microlunatus parietis]|uniref:Phosphoenolpyruvate synthase/pyruvate phosphate dikinase n=1 Tax=Microlunatus parietis TaxID=682979 RepID=A0A7Y9IF70_9ACTN|nr:PEP-utilizing enzyme [Microlunatus parietis]NYE75670.1 phosphoenolpyruvate synthase/pyruvate phosphate dikinase [Microlunatus parietis]
MIITGIAASPGTAEGRIRVITSLDDFGRFGAGEILVCRTTSPAWTPLLSRAAAVITEVGSRLAHAAIVARELGIPAVVGADRAMSILRDGQRARVDGTAGTIMIMEAAAR